MSQYLGIIGIVLAGIVAGRAVILFRRWLIAKLLAYRERKAEQALIDDSMQFLGRWKKSDEERPLPLVTATDVFAKAENLKRRIEAERKYTGVEPTRTTDASVEFDDNMRGFVNGPRQDTDEDIINRAVARG